MHYHCSTCHQDAVTVEYDQDGYAVYGCSDCGRKFNQMEGLVILGESTAFYIEQPKRLSLGCLTPCVA